jgi:hypothetical protein
MATSLYSPDFLAVFNNNRDAGGTLKAFASPADWRDLMVDRLNNSLAATLPLMTPITMIFRVGI